MGEGGWHQARDTLRPPRRVTQDIGLHREMQIHAEMSPADQGLDHASSRRLVGSDTGPRGGLWRTPAPRPRGKRRKKPAGTEETRPWHARDTPSTTAAGPSRKKNRSHSVLEPRERWRPFPKHHNLIHQCSTHVECSPPLIRCRPPPCQRRKGPRQECRNGVRADLRASQSRPRPGRHVPFSRL